MTTRDRARVLVAVVLTLAIVVPLGVLWQGSRLPSSYSALDLGKMEYGGGPRAAAAGHVGQSPVSVRDLDTPPGRTADVVVDLTARQGRVRLASGRTVDGYSLNGTSPGPQIEARVGQLVEVRLWNVNVVAGVALHWHGVDVPNAQDGVAGITQDAVRAGESFTYRWIAPRAGTFWYHSHQVSHVQVARGLLGPLVIHREQESPGVRDVVALAHVYDGQATMNGHDGIQPVEAAAGEQLRVRLINSDNATQFAWASEPYTAVAFDGYDVNRPTDISDTAVAIPAGGRVDIVLTVPAAGRGARVMLGDAGLALGPAGVKTSATEQPSRTLDRARYGTPARVPFDTSRHDRSFTYSIGRRPGFLNGRPGLWWSVNGHLAPKMPMMVIGEGEVVRMRISNHSGQVHPMHLHGHHPVVLARNKEPVTGSTWWFDSLDVKSGESYDVAFLADNPGIWMDHCHNLNHAVDGLVTHVVYEGVTTPYRIGESSGNEPE